MSFLEKVTPDKLLKSFKILDSKTQWIIISSVLYRYKHLKTLFDSEANKQLKLLIYLEAQIPAIDRDYDFGNNFPTEDYFVPSIELSLLHNINRINDMCSSFLAEDRVAGIIDELVLYNLAIFATAEKFFLNYDCKILKQIPDFMNRGVVSESSLYDYLHE
jgi:hypothetical protein